MDNAKIGKLIFTLRKNASLTQNQLAEKLKVSDKAYYKIKAYGLTFGTFNSKVYTICEECWNKIVGGKEDE